MNMRHLLVTFVNKDPYSACIINSYESQYDADRAAAAYLDDHPEDAAHVYSWSSGYVAEQRVSITKEWVPPELPPTPVLDPPIIPEVLAELATGPDSVDPALDDIARTETP